MSQGVSTASVYSVNDVLPTFSFVWATFSHSIKQCTLVLCEEQYGRPPDNQRGETLRRRVRLRNDYGYGI